MLRTHYPTRYVHYHSHLSFQPILVLIVIQIHPTPAGHDAGKGVSHATGKSIVPKKLQEVLPEKVERAVPNAIHDTSDPAHGIKK